MIWFQTFRVNDLRKEIIIRFIKYLGLVKQNHTFETTSYLNNQFDVIEYRKANFILRPRLRSIFNLFSEGF